MIFSENGKFVFFMNDMEILDNLYTVANKYGNFSTQSSKKSFNLLQFGAEMFFYFILGGRAENRFPQVLSNFKISLISILKYDASCQ
jgi:hypothetical protein